MADDRTDNSLFEPLGVLSMLIAMFAPLLCLLGEPITKAFPDTYQRQVINILFFGVPGVAVVLGIVSLLRKADFGGCAGIVIGTCWIAVAMFLSWVLAD